MNLPRLLPEKSADRDRSDSVLLAVYAPFGTDDTLSTYPDGSAQTLAQHPLYEGLLKVAAQGVHVAALVDRTDDDTWLVEIDAGRPEDVRVTSRWKQDMDSPRNLAGFLRHAHQSHPDAAIVLALEGHGAGYLPEIDHRALSTANITQGGEVEWRIGGKQSGPFAGAGHPTLPEGSPLLVMGSPVLPMGSPVLPVNHMPLSTWGLGAALKAALEAGVPKLSVIHFNNCFNMSIEVMHTIAPYAEYATGYPNYNFFTAGQSYPAVFEKLRQAGSASSQQLAQWFAEGNHEVLAAKKNHPTIGCVVRLGRLHSIAECIDDLADALLAALRGAADRPAVVAKIRRAIILAQQFDTPGASFELETPDELTDIYSLASTLLRFDFRPHPVHPACRALQDALKGIKLTSDKDEPWVAHGQVPPVIWDFSSPQLAMNIFLPDPILLGRWDWRSPYYLDVNPDPTQPLVQPHIIEFVKVTDWVDFLIEYHKETPFVGLLPAAIPEFPVFNAKFDPKAPKDPGCDDPGKPGHSGDGASAA
jgi:hypothetical protein